MNNTFLTLSIPRFRLLTMLMSNDIITPALSNSASKIMFNCYVFDSQLNNKSKNIIRVDVPAPTRSHFLQPKINSQTARKVNTFVL